MRGVDAILKRILVFLFGASILLHATVVFAASPIVGTLVDNDNLNGVEDVFLCGDLAYLPCREGHCLTVCTIKDPARPQVVGTFRDPDLDDVTGFALDGNTAYLASQSSHFLLIVDVSTPENMKLLGKVRISQQGSKGPLYKMAYRNGFCYMSHQGEKKLYIVDVRDKRHPRVIGNTQVTTDGDGAYCVTMKGDYALVGTVFGKNNRLAVVNVTDPAHPRMVGELKNPHLSEGIGTVYRRCIDRSPFEQAESLCRRRRPRLSSDHRSRWRGRCRYFRSSQAPFCDVIQRPRDEKAVWADGAR